MTDVAAPKTRRPDPLGVRAELPLTGIFYPMGFRLDLSTNSRDVIEAAEESWGGQRLEFETAPLTMRVSVRPEGDLSPITTHRKAGHLYSAIADAHNFAQIDLREQFASIHVSRKTASDHTWLRWFFVESMAYLMLNQRHIVMIHAGFVARGGRGVLLCGASTAGKSTLAYACARSGWTFLSDDCSALLPDSADRIALGRPRQVRFRPDTPRLFPELEGLVARARPTGKIAIEVPTAELGIQTADRAPVAAIAFLERRPGAPSVRELPSEKAVRRLLTDLGTYGDEVDAIHERAVRRVATAPAYLLQYDTIQDGIDTLSAL